jgi:hypothetical protein
MVKAVVTSHDPIHLNETKRTNMHDLDPRQIYITLLLCIAVRITEYTVKKVSDFLGNLFTV